jgi:3',5'-cyclic AMP phosphodiesterase CpdA
MLRLLPAALAALLLATPTAGSPAAEGTRLLLAAGDIASCGSNGDEKTAALLRARPRAVVATLGDNAYDAGRPDEFERCYAPSWGSVKARTKPAAGNHDYRTEGAAGYFAYFGRRAGHPSRGWYSYRLGRWHVIVLNSNCEHVGGCRRGSAQERWLRRTLAANHATCTLAYWHHPRFSSGDHHGGSAATADFWDALYEAGADVVLSGHDHVYERFAPQTPAGEAAPRRGVRAFVVGTGGASLYGFRKAEPNSLVRVARYGVLALALGRGRYSWRFLTADGGVSDAGSARCVRAR